MNMKRTELLAVSLYSVLAVALFVGHVADRAVAADAAQKPSFASSHPFIDPNQKTPPCFFVSGDRIFGFDCDNQKDSLTFGDDKVIVPPDPAFFTSVYCDEAGVEIEYLVSRYNAPGTWSDPTPFPWIDNTLPVLAWRLQLWSGDELVTTAPCRILRAPTFGARPKHNGREQ